MNKKIISKNCLQCGKEFYKGSNRGIKDWNNRTKYCSKECTNLSKRKPNQEHSKRMKGSTPWNKGKTMIYSKETIEKMSRTKKEKWKLLNEETKNKILSNLKPSIYKGIPSEKHPCWKGGKRKDRHPYEFNNILKLEIRKRDNYTCQECKYSEDNLHYTLHVHHIDYDKNNNSPNNLISLCRSCHSQTNFKRDDWTNYFENKTAIIG